jgi:hypothetical protein
LLLSPAQVLEGHFKGWDIVGVVGEVAHFDYQYKNKAIIHNNQIELNPFITSRDSTLS